MLKLSRRVRLVPSAARLSWLRLLGLKAARDIIVSRRINWPWLNLRQITLGEDVALGANGCFHIVADNGFARISIGNGSAVGEGFVISAESSIRIGDNCLLSYRVSVLDHDHITGYGIDPVHSGTTPGAPIEIGDNCFIGCGSVILRGVSLGRNCVVGANLVVNRFFADCSVLAGAPGRPIRRQLF